MFVPACIVAFQIDYVPTNRSFSTYYFANMNLAIFILKLIIFATCVADKSTIYELLSELIQPEDSSTMCAVSDAAFYASIFIFKFLKRPALNFI